MADAKVALVIGAGEATGGAIARRFARGGYTACVTRRDADKLGTRSAQQEPVCVLVNEIHRDGWLVFVHRIREESPNYPFHDWRISLAA